MNLQTLKSVNNGLIVSTETVSMTTATCFSTPAKPVIVACLFNVVFPSLSTINGRNKDPCNDKLAFVQSCLKMIGQIYTTHKAPLCSPGASGFRPGALETCIVG